MDTPDDRRARAIHAGALAALPAATRQALRRPRAARRAEAPSRRPAPASWGLAFACAALAAILLSTGLPGLPGAGRDAGTSADAALAARDEGRDPARVPAGMPVSTAADDVLAAYEQDPDFFLWLASAEAAPLAME